MIRNLEYCRKFKAHDIEHSNASFVKKNNLIYEEYDCATILPIKCGVPDLKWGYGGVLNSNGEYISLSSQLRRIDYGYHCDNARYSGESVVYCGYFSNHWGHFLLDCTSRLWFSLYNNELVDKYVFVVEETKKELIVNGNFREFFRLLGILEKVEVIAEPVCYKHVIIPENSYLYRKYWSDEFIGTFDYISKAAIKEMEIKGFSPQSKVFFSRSHFLKAKKSEVGLEMLDDFFGGNDFYICWPEEMPLAEMIALMSSAKICAFESGTTPHNLLFAKNRQETLIIERSSTVNNYQCDVDVIKDLTVTYVDAYYTLYPVTAGGGPFYLVYNEFMSNFSNDHSYIPPDNKYLSEKYTQRCLRNYMKCYRSNYEEILGFEDWHSNYLYAFFEAYRDTQKSIGDYLLGERLYTPTQLFRWSVIKKQISCIKRKLIKIKSYCVR